MCRRSANYSKKYIARDCIQKSKINEYILKNKIKGQLENQCKNMKMKN